VKPHGQLYLAAVYDKSTARGIVRALKAVDPDLLLLLYGPVVEVECRDLGIGLAVEGYVDQDYNPDFSIAIERVKKGRAPDDVADACLQLIRDGGRRANDGTWLPIAAKSICLHGDGPNVVDIARAVHRRLGEAGVAIASLREMVLSR
jgi:UPF0271 protein